MKSKFQNRLKRVLYRPVKKKPHMDLIAKKLGEAEEGLNNTIGGMFSKKGNARRKKKGTSD
jgi:hypothetical protein